MRKAYDLHLQVFSPGLVRSLSIVTTSPNEMLCTNRVSETTRPLADGLKATGPMMALLSEALLPNLVQTTEGTPAMVHCGPFGNIAHGTSSVIFQKDGLRMAD